MVKTVVKASANRKKGSAESRRLRATGMLPGVIYGLDKEPIAVAVQYTDLRDALKTDQGMNAVFSLDIDGNDQETVIVRDVQRDIIRRVVIHADFLRVDIHQPIRVKVPIHIVGDDSGVTSEGGLIEQNLFEIEVEALPLQVPNYIEADISIMTLDRALSVADLVFPDGVEPMVSEEVSVVAPVIPAAIEEPVVPSEDGEEADAGEGQADANGDQSEGEASSDSE